MSANSVIIGVIRFVLPKLLTSWWPTWLAAQNTPVHNEELLRQRPGLAWQQTAPERRGHAQAALPNPAGHLNASSAELH